nr:hypothetical protein [Tanacetum cinerariifolium]
INPFKTSKEEKHVPNTVRASARTKPITVSQPPAFTKKDVNSDSNGLSSKRIDNTKTRRPHPRINTKNDRIERLQAQLGDLKGKCKDTSCVSDTQNQLFQKLDNANVELEFQVFNYARENAHLKTTYKNLFDSISVSRVQTETKIASLQNELQSNIYKNAKVSDQKDNTQDSSKNTKFAK